MKTLETDRLVLRAFRLEDLDDFFEYARDPDVGPNAGWMPHQNKEESLRILQSFIDGDEVWAITFKESGRVIGSLGIHPDKKRGAVNARSMGYVLSKDYWGRGLVTEAAQRVIEFVFDQMRIDLLSIIHYPFNLRSKRVIDKCGFTYEGTLRQASRLFSGEIYDDVCYSMLRSEYLARRE